MTEELNGGCLDEREAHYAQIWKERTRKTESIAELMAVLVTMRAGDEYDDGQGFKPPFINNLWQGFKAGCASLSTSKQAEAEQCRTCGETQPHTGTCGTADSDTQALCKRTPPAVMPAAPSDAECRKAWAKHAAKQHSWLNNSSPPMRDGRFDCGQHESEYQTFLAGVRYGRS